MQSKFYFLFLLVIILTKIININLFGLELSENSPLKGKKLLVFYNKDSNITNEDISEIISTINSKISSLKLEYVEYDRAIELSKKFEKVFEEKKGEAMSLAQLMAQEEKADIYIEVGYEFKREDLKQPKGWTKIDFSLTLRTYDTSTARGLGTSKTNISGIDLTLNKEKLKKRLIDNAVESTIKELIPNLEKYLSKGEPIELKVIGLTKPSQIKYFSDFINTLPAIENSKKKSISKDIVIFEIIYKGGSKSFINDFLMMIENYTQHEVKNIDFSGNSVIIELKESK